VVAISGQVPSAVLGRGTFQDLDLSAVFRDVTAWTATVHSGATTLNWPHSPSSTRWTPAGWRTWCCPTRYR
jgi:hypothetical protein